MFVTAQGSAYSRLKRAIERRNVLVAWPRRRSCPASSCVMPCFEKAAVRWHARLCLEAPLSLDEAQLALAALGARSTRSRRAGADALYCLMDNHGLGRAAQVLADWGSNRTPPP
jgi:hypothetical protein